MAVPFPGVGIDPRVPQKRTCISTLFVSSARIPQRFQQKADVLNPAYSSQVLLRHSGPGYILYCMQFDERPWGSFTVLDEAPGYKVKRIEVLPGKRLRYQKPAQRSEHWMVVEGAGKVTLDGKEVIVKTGETVDVSTTVAHRIENPGQEKLVFIEIQRGKYLGEHDIVRLEDDFGRAQA